MNPEDVGRILDEIGERIGPAGEYAWTITVRQVVIESWVWIAVGVLVLVAGIAIVAFALRGTNEDLTDGQGVAAVTGFIAATGAVIVLGVNVTQILNPEYHAMIRLLERVVPQ